MHPRDTPHGTDFQPHIKILRASQVPNPILPVDYGYWLVSLLPPECEDLCFDQLLLQARAVWARQPQNKFWGPFGRVVGYELCPAPGVTYRLDINMGVVPDGQDTATSTGR